VPVYLEEVDLTPELDLALNRVQALHRDQDTDYRQHLLNALRGPSTAPRALTGSQDERDMEAGSFSREATEPAMPRSLVVLPFANLSTDPEQEFFVDGITEDLINRLTHIADLRVIARTSSFQFKGKTDDAREIGQKLGVTHLVAGSVRRAGNQVRITAQLVRADDGTHDWSKQYTRDLDDVFALQDEITLEIASQLTQALKPAQSGYQPKTEAYEELLRGRSWRRHLSYGAAVRALRHFENAIDHDPRFALAYAEAAKASIWEYRFDVKQPRATLERAVKFNDAALAIDADLLLARVNRAMLLLYLEYRLQDAITAMQALQSEAPASPEVLERLCMVFMWAGRFDALEAAALELKRIDPYAVVAHSCLLWVYDAAQRWVEFDRTVETIFSIEPEHKNTWAWWAITKAERDRVDEAYEMIVAKGMQDWPHACFVYARQGDRDRIVDVIAKLEPLPGLRISLAHCYALIEDLEGVVRMVRAAVENHDPLLSTIVSKGRIYYRQLGINGRPLGDIYSSDEVQAVLREVGLDRRSIDAIRI
jgi:TolB-like protein